MRTGDAAWAEVRSRSARRRGMGLGLSGVLEADFGEFDPGGGLRGLVAQTAEDGAETVRIEGSRRREEGGDAEGVGSRRAEHEVLPAALRLDGFIQAAPSHQDERTIAG